jgi:hypothetical protein
MPTIPSRESEALTPVLTSEERWRRWEQRGRDDDARFMDHVRRGFWSAVIVLTVILVLAFLV